MMTPTPTLQPSPAPRRRSRQPPYPSGVDTRYVRPCRRRRSPAAPTSKPPPAPPSLLPPRQWPSQSVCRFHARQFPFHVTRGPFAGCLLSFAVPGLRFHHVTRGTSTGLLPSFTAPSLGDPASVRPKDSARRLAPTQVSPSYLTLSGSLCTNPAQPSSVQSSQLRPSQPAFLRHLSFRRSLSPAPSRQPPTPMVPHLCPSASPPPHAAPVATFLPQPITPAHSLPHEPPAAVTSSITCPQLPHPAESPSHTSVSYSGTLAAMAPGNRQGNLQDVQ